MTREDFYERCARLLHSQHSYHTEPKTPTSPHRDGSIRNTYKNRWNGRAPGNGRFAGCGFIRHFGSTIQVNLYNPPLTGIFEDEDAVLVALMGVT